MLKNLKHLGFIALVCSVAGLVGCGGGSGTDNKKVDLLVCTGTDVILANGSCGEAPPLPDCPDGEVRPTPTAACVEADFELPTKPTFVEAKALLNEANNDSFTEKDYAVIYINKANATKDFSGYSLYTWQACSETWLNASNPDSTGADNWTSETINPITSTPETADPIYGGYFIVKLKPGGTCGSFIIRTPGRGSQTSNLRIETDAASTSLVVRKYFVIENPTTGLVSAQTSAIPICINDICEAYIKPALALSNVSAHWIDASTILWDQNATNVQLYAANDGAKITANLDGTVAGGTAAAVDLTSVSMTDEQKALYPHLTTYKAYSINLSSDAIKALLKKELVIVGEVDGAKIGTRIQNYGVLDAVYTAGENDANEAKLGAVYSANDVTVSVWAPTASMVELRLFSDTPTPTVDGVPGYFPSIATKPMTFDSLTGIWSYTGTKAELDLKFYRYRVTGYNYLTNKTQKLEVSDPHAVSLSADGSHSQIVNLSDASLKPSGWEGHVAPLVDSFASMSIYEMHVRDFSISDESTPVAHRGKYLAFTDTSSAPVQHLMALKEAGLTHVHLLPVNDGSSIKERGKQYNLDSLVREICVAAPKASVCANPGQIINVNASNNATLRSVLKGYSGDTDKARKLMESLSSLDGFNWNYDPQFFNAPEGSYATKADGVTRILEMRAMNLALHQLGLRVVLDVVYPHMASSGVDAGNSTFDKIVPGYYFRQNIVTGSVENAGAGPDTATEHVMMSKFMSDSLVQWADQYKVDGFRFDQSGFIPKAALVSALDAVKVVDPDTYFYAEAWVGSGGTDTSGARIAERASQKPLAGTGIGTFNDVMRNPLRELALVNGGDLNKVRAGLAGNLKEFKLLAKSGTTIKASTVDAYGLDPQESINYVDVHDNDTLWDWMHRPNALPAETSIDNRVRINSLTLSVPLLSQGVPLIHMGSDFLRSKSMSSDSYNDGDWFNYVDFTKQTNNWRVGLPTKHDATDEQILAAFADPQSTPTPANILQASKVFNEFLAVSKSSSLFSLKTAAEVLDRVGFHDGGVTQKNNLIVMSIDDGVGMVTGTMTPRADLDPNVNAIVVVFNGSATAVSHKILTSTGFTLHALQDDSVDAVVATASFAEGTGDDLGNGTFTVPAYTTAVFVKAQAGAQGAGLSATVTSGYEVPAPFGETAVYVRGEVTTPNWSTADSTNKLVYESNGVYSVNLTLAPGTYAFKVASGDWNTVDRGVLKTDPLVVVGTPKTMAVGGVSTVDNASIVIATAGTYRFELNAITATAPILTVTDVDVFKATAIYVRGEVTTPNWSTADSTNQLIHEGNSVYGVTLPLVAGTYAFKVASADWNTVDRGVLKTDPLVVVSTAKNMAKGGVSTVDNASIVITKAGNYHFRLNARNSEAPILTVFEANVFAGTSIYVRGEVTTPNWSTADSTNELVYDSTGVYSVNLNLAAGTYAFKVASADWNTVDRGVLKTDPLVVVGTPKAMAVGGVSTVDNASIVLTAAGSYKFALDTVSSTAPILKVTAN